MDNKCWICEEEEATTGEHVIMKAAYEKLLGVKNGEQAYISYVNPKMKTVSLGSFGNNRLKFNKSICQTCNSDRTQSYDNEFMKLVEKLIKSKNLIISRNLISLNGFKKSNLALYFIKIFGCLIKELNGKVTLDDYELIRQSILCGKVLTKNIYLSFHRSLGYLESKDTETVSTYPVFTNDACVWSINLDWISCIICYPVPLNQGKYGTQWNLSADILNLSIGKLQ